MQVRPRCRMRVTTASGCLAILLSAIHDRRSVLSNERLVPVLVAMCPRPSGMAAVCCSWLLPLVAGRFPSIIPFLIAIQSASLRILSGCKIPYQRSTSSMSSSSLSSGTSPSTGFLPQTAMNHRRNVLRSSVLMIAQPWALPPLVISPARRAAAALRSAMLDVSAKYMWPSWSVSSGAKRGVHACNVTRCACSSTFRFRLYSVPHALSCQVHDRISIQLQNSAEKETERKNATAYLPPMTFESPLKIFVKLVTTMSANGNVSTIVYNHEEVVLVRRCSRSGKHESRFEGNSVKSARTGGLWGFCACSVSRSVSSLSMEESKPWPKKWQSGPHFSRTLRVLV